MGSFLDQQWTFLWENHFGCYYSINHGYSGSIISLWDFSISKLRWTICDIFVHINSFPNTSWFEIKKQMRIFCEWSFILWKMKDQMLHFCEWSFLCKETQYSAGFSWMNLCVWKMACMVHRTEASHGSRGWSLHNEKKWTCKKENWKESNSERCTFFIRNTSVLFTNNIGSTFFSF